MRKLREHSGEDPKREPENLDLGIRLLGWLPEGLNPWLTWKLYRHLALWSGCGFLGGMESHVKTTLSFRDYRII